MVLCLFPIWLLTPRWDLDDLIQPGSAFFIQWEAITNSSNICVSFLFCQLLKISSESVLVKLHKMFFHFHTDVIGVSHAGAELQGSKGGICIFEKVLVFAKTKKPSIQVSLSKNDKHNILKGNLEPLKLIFVLCGLNVFFILSPFRSLLPPYEM